MSPRIFYHYTDQKGKEGINSSGYIRMSTEQANNRDVRYGEGVYFTSLPPTLGKQKIAVNNFGPTGNLPNVQKRVAYVIIVEFIPGMEPENRSKEPAREVYVYPGDVFLGNKDVVKKWEIQGVPLNNVQ